MHTMRRLMTLCEQEQWIEAHERGEVVLRARTPDGELVPPSRLYRIMSPAEYRQAERSGVFRPKPGERLHASAAPRRTYAEGDSLLVTLRYEESDGWRPKWGMGGSELYAVTDHAVPFDRVISVETVY